jgi:hypothetical protein
VTRKSRREIPFLAAAGLAYVLALLLPVDDGFGVNFSGWQILRVLFYFDRYHEISDLADALSLLSLWTNVAFVVYFAILASRSRERSPFLVWSLACFAVFNLAFWVGQESWRNLGLGFYLWIVSFGCLSAAAHLGLRRADPS